MRNQKSVTLLNEAVADELKAIHQYMYWHFHLDDQGFAPLAGLFKRVAVMEMGHVELLAERILFLNGDVDMVAGGSVERINDPQEILTRASEMEEEAITMYNKFALECGQNADSVTKQVFESLVNDEESHFDQFDTQLDNIKRFGLSYLALQSFGSAPPETAGE